jgi:uncharacterized protein (DUF1810 family)
MSADDPHDLARFLEAQEGVHPRALQELRAGRKRTHWMWFVFPQLAGLGRSPTARFYALRSRAEAAAYLAHPVLGPRLREAVQAALEAPEGADAQALFGVPDDMKFRSCLTLFAQVADDPAPFRAALARFFDGREDPRTRALLEAG